MTWLAETADGATPLEEVLGLRPELEVLLGDYLDQAWSGCDAVLLELCRLRIATLHGDVVQQRLRHDTALAAGLTEDKVAALARHHDSPLFSELERACVSYAELYVIDVHSITDADADRVKAGMSDAEFVAFTVALGLFDGIGRFRLILGLGEVAEPAAVGPIVVATPAPGRPGH